MAKSILFGLLMIVSSTSMAWETHHPVPGESKYYGSYQRYLSERIALNIPRTVEEQRIQQLSIEHLQLMVRQRKQTRPEQHKDSKIIIFVVK